LMAHVESSPAGQPMCVWTEDSRKFAIHLHPEVIGRLATESWVAFKRVPRRGLEIGGILLGHIDSQDDTTNFRIAGFEPVESEHRSGPSYVLSESDFGHLQKALTKNGTSTIGVYRSQTRSERLDLQDADGELFQRCFPTGDALFLMLAPVPGIAAFFVRTDGRLKCVHEFALTSSLSTIITVRQGRTAPEIRLPNPTLPAEIQAAPSSIVRQPSGVVQPLDPPKREEPVSAPSGTLDHPQPPAPALKRPARKLKFIWNIKKGEWLLAAAIACLIFAATASVLSYSLPHPPAPDRPGRQYLPLTVERVGPSLRLLWDRNASALRGATRAVLHIQDGDQQSDKDLGPAQFSAGSILYEPKNADVTFRLDVYAAEPNATGSVQVMNLPPQTTITPSVPAQPNLKPAPTQPSNNPILVQTSLARNEAASAFPIKPAAADPIKGDTESEELRSSTYKSSSGPEPDSVGTHPPPAPAALEKTEQRSPVAENRPPERPSSLRTASVVEQPALPNVGREPSISISAEPVSGSRLGQLAGKIPLVRRLKKPVKIATPVALYQAQPALKSSDMESLVRPVSVGVKVVVGESGKVTDAEVVEYGDPPAWNLANAALAAARRWTFEPPPVDDSAITSELILHFRFSP
ncbi:MAG: hypothetical protein JWO19_4904, partial [Bryobacterales bacterium]|nr:hypothetical protein [Bryobacterales bacterium]